MGAPPGVASGPPAGPLVQVAAVQSRLLAVVQAQGEGPLVGVEGEDLAAAAVGHPQSAEGVLAADHQIPDRELAIPDLEALGAELAGVPAELLAGGVELVDLLAPVGQDRHPVAVLERLPPVGQQDLLELAGRLGRDQPPVGTVSAQGRVEVAGAQVLDRLALHPRGTYHLSCTDPLWPPPVSLTQPRARPTLRATEPARPLTEYLRARARHPYADPEWLWIGAGAG
jgi:hypothetical protein